MPELPEVETIARYLREGKESQPSLIGLKIQEAVLLWEKTLAFPSPPKLLDHIRHQIITRISRRGKFIHMQLTHDILLVHLRMSGDLWVEPQTTPTAPHHRWMLHFDNGWRLALNDPRKFARVWLVSDAQCVLGKLGPEPLDEALTESAFYQRLHAYRRQLKPLLLDQHFLAGLGNIYTDEALHLAKLHPMMDSHSVSEAQSKVLLSSIRQVLQEGVIRQGASIDWVYRGGDFQNYFRVYQRTGEPCPVCGTPIERTTVGQRGTHFCPICQKKNG
ncbi:MAG: bifunctional DNA-formamidopyrimidine glycosylase/DNA-(apurinic or apyrimidinic site) lyase [Anaerolineales bacterium]|nr:bifunctional DNA-formamidopyrimidine glycosylase/DNA-(apurinic or apyrimidinic site) lyase [Anaerolineales bacterium]